MKSKITQTKVDKIAERAIVEKCINNVQLTPKEEDAIIKSFSRSIDICVKQMKRKRN
ncbi:MAG: hypothetical protein QXE90_01490 [Candidatus Micrarchaeia archaeon]